jgi:hypothetical protein
VCAAGAGRGTAFAVCLRCARMWPSRGTTAIVLLGALGALVPLSLGANHYCEVNVPKGTRITRFEGKMNVPLRPAVEPGKVLFLWPGLNPYGGQGGMMQPVLTYGINYGQGERKWGIANWFTNCPGYCHDKYQAVEEGDVLLWSMQHMGTQPNGTARWDMHWRKQDSLQMSTFPIYREMDDAVCFWATEAEFYLNSSDPSNYAKLPRSPFYTWDIKATTQDGASLPLPWTTHGDTPGDVRVNCDWKNGTKQHVGTSLTFPQPTHRPTPAEAAAAAAAAAPMATSAPGVSNLCGPFWLRFTYVTLFLSRNIEGGNAPGQATASRSDPPASSRGDTCGPAPSQKPPPPPRRPLPPPPPAGNCGCCTPPPPRRAPSVWMARAQATTCGLEWARTRRTSRSTSRAVAGA